MGTAPLSLPLPLLSPHRDWTELCCHPCPPIRARLLPTPPFPCTQIGPMLPLHIQINVGSGHSPSPWMARLGLSCSLPIPTPYNQSMLLLCQLHVSQIWLADGPGTAHSACRVKRLGTTDLNYFKMFLYTSASSLRISIHIKSYKNAGRISIDTISLFFWPATTTTPSVVAVLYLGLKS